MAFRHYLTKLTSPKDWQRQSGMPMTPSPHQLHQCDIMGWRLEWSHTFSLPHWLFDLRVSLTLSKAHVSHLKNMEAEPSDVHRTFPSCDPITFWNEERLLPRKVEHQLVNTFHGGLKFNIKLYSLKDKANILGPIYKTLRPTLPHLFSLEPGFCAWPSLLTRTTPATVDSIVALSESLLLLLLGSSSTKERRPLQPHMAWAGSHSSGWLRWCWCNSVVEGEVGTMGELWPMGDKKEQKTCTQIAYLLDRCLPNRLFQEAIILIWCLWRCLCKTKQPMCLLWSSSYLDHVPPYICSSLILWFISLFPWDSTL